MRITQGILMLAVCCCFLGGCTNRYGLYERSTVDILLEKPESREVYFVSSLNGFEPRKLNRQEDGVWRVTVPAGGEFSYFFLVDGSPHIPPCRLKESDDYGNQNCIYSPLR